LPETDVSEILKKIKDILPKHRFFTKIKSIFPIPQAQKNGLSRFSQNFDVF